MSNENTATETATPAKRKGPQGVIVSRATADKLHSILCDNAAASGGRGAAAVLTEKLGVPEGDVWAAACMSPVKRQSAIALENLVSGVVSFK